MLSIIISSYNKSNFENIQNNIAETCGIDYELIKIDNPNLMGICEAYNKGATKAQYHYLLFIHEDIIFHTQNWGELLIKHLEKENTGVLGIAGSNYVPKAPTGWYLFDNTYNFSNCIQNNKEKSNPRLIHVLNSKVNIFSVDGVFLAVKKNVYNEFPFNENIKGFHGYDLDFSLRVATKYKNYVIHDILLEHFSEGNPDKIWFENNILIRKKIKYKFNKIFDEKLETDSFHIFLNGYFSHNRFIFKNVISTLCFLPSQLKLSSYFFIIKHYLYLLKRNKLY